MKAVSKKRLSRRRRRESFGEGARDERRARAGNARDASFATYLLRDARGSLRLRLERRVVLRGERRGVASECPDGAPRNVAGAQARAARARGRASASRRGQEVRAQYARRDVHVYRGRKRAEGPETCLGMWADVGDTRFFREPLGPKPKPA